MTRAHSLNDFTVIVVGGGVGGMAAAIALAQRGARVTLLEQADALREVGAGLQISPNGLRVLRALGLEPGLIAGASQGKSVSLRRAENDREVARLDLTRLPAEQRYFFVHRADLIGLLENGALDAGVDICLNSKVAQIVLGTPATVVLEGGQRLESDLVIDAGGLHSTLRGVLNGASDAFFTGQVAWRAVIANEGARQSDVQVHMAPKHHLVSYPIKGGAFINLVGVQERSAWAAEGWSQRDDPANLRAAFEGAAPAVQRMLDKVEDVHLWGLFRHQVAAHWQGERCALLGDAAHPTLPFLAQGANMALEDAWALSSCLLTERTLSDRLRRYETLRKPRVRKVIDAANGNAWKYHLNYGPLRLAAHLGLALGSRLAPSLMLRQFDWLYGYDITKQV